MALGRLFTIAANFTDPDAYFVGGGVVEATAEFRDWFLARVVRTPICARSSGGWRASSWCPISTWPARADRPSRHWPASVPEQAVGFGR